MKPFVLALTGSIGMGKSTAAGFFREAGVPVWDADEAVGRLYARGGAAVPEIARLCPEAVKDEAVDREALKAWILRDPEALTKIEKAVHPLVASDREDFLVGAEAAEEPIVVLDVPLLFETGADVRADAVVVVSAPPDVQRVRVMARPGMTEKAFQMLLDKQLPDRQKRERADFVIPSTDKEATRAAIFALVDRIRTLRRHA
ncbi:MAG: dephospho-CoA kinase [Rhodobacteraceae bacterium]|nr:dephospho-CoA kinase [Paracoccaceae bacterium]